MGTSIGLGLIGNVASSIIGSNAAGDAAKQQAAALAQAQQQIAKYYGEAKTNLTPDITAGQNATTKLQALLGIGGAAGSDPSSTITSALEQTPGYQFNLNQGLKATQNNLTAQGLGGSGQAVAGAANYAQGLAGNTYGQVAGLLQNLSGQGQSAATALGGFGTQTGQTSANLYNTLGNDQAASTIAQGNIWSGLANNLGGAYGNYNAANMLGSLYGNYGAQGGGNPLQGIVNQVSGGGNSSGILGTISSMLPI